MFRIWAWCASTWFLFSIPYDYAVKNPPSWIVLDAIGAVFCLTLAIYLTLKDRRNT